MISLVSRLPSLKKVVEFALVQELREMNRLVLSEQELGLGWMPFLLLKKLCSFFLNESCERPKQMLST